MNRRHGTRSRYVGGCRCDECREANRVAYQQWRRRKALVAWGMADPPLIDSTRAREHVDWLMAHGMGVKQIARVGGVAATVISRLARMDRSRPAVRVHPETEAKILAVAPTLDNLADGARVPAGPTARRVRALVAIGYPMKHLGARLGITQQNMHLHTLDDYDLVYAYTARNVAALYDELSMVIPPASRVKNRACNHAASRGWPPPLAWEDIDAGELAEGWDDHRRKYGADNCNICNDIEHLRFMGEVDNTALADRLGVTPHALHRHLTRHQRLDLWGAA